MSFLFLDSVDDFFLSSLGSKFLNLVSKKSESNQTSHFALKNSNKIYGNVYPLQVILVNIMGVQVVAVYSTCLLQNIFPNFMYNCCSLAPVPCPTFLAPSTGIKINKNSKKMKYFLRTYVRRAYFHHTEGENLTMKQKNKQNKFSWRKKIK